MKAWRVEAHGGPEAHVLRDVPKPEPGPGEVRVRIEAVGLNHMDVWVRKGIPGHKFPLPMTVGCDSAGILDAVGPGVEKQLASDGLKVGSPVVVNPILSCGRCEACFSGYDAICSQFGMPGETQDGGCAEYLVVPAANVVARPVGLSAAEAASIPVAFVTAYQMLTRKARVRPADLVLIQAGGSGVSIAAIQLAKVLGATVITTVGADEKIPQAKALGADWVIQYRKTPFRDEVKKIARELGKKGVDVAIEHVGGETFTESLKCLAWGGKLVTCGATAGAQVTVDLKPIFFKNIEVLGSTMGSKADLSRILALAASHRIRPVIDSTFSMKDLPRAIERLESRGLFGKVVVTSPLA